MKRRKVPFYILVALSPVFFTGCGINYKTVVDARVVPIKNQEKIYEMVTSRLIGLGFDIKLADKDVGFIITKYKKYGQTGLNPPFDLYLQIIVRFTRTDGKPVIIFEPRERQVDPSNPDAFSNIQTIFFGDQEDKNSHKLNFIIRKPGFLLFTKVVKEIAADFGAPMDQVKFNTADRKQIIVRPNAMLE